jgi:hypothetical protein
LKLVADEQPGAPRARFPTGRISDPYKL